MGSDYSKTKRNSTSKLKKHTINVKFDNEQRPFNRPLQNTDKPVQIGGFHQYMINYLLSLVPQNDNTITQTGGDPVTKREDNLQSPIISDCGASKGKICKSKYNFPDNFEQIIASDPKENPVVINLLDKQQGGNKFDVGVISDHDSEADQLRDSFNSLDQYPARISSERLKSEHGTEEENYKSPKKESKKTVDDEDDLDDFDDYVDDSSSDSEERNVMKKKKNNLKRYYSDSESSSEPYHKNNKLSSLSDSLKNDSHSSINVLPQYMS
jgi:hypothetical protein